MEQVEREAIKKHLITLTRDTNLDNLMIFVEQQKLLDKPEIDRINNARLAREGSNAAANHLFYSIIQTRRGAFANLCTGLRKFNQGHLADILEKELPNYRAPSSNPTSDTRQPVNYCNRNENESDGGCCCVIC